MCRFLPEHLKTALFSPVLGAAPAHLHKHHVGNFWKSASEKCLDLVDLISLALFVNGSESVKVSCCHSGGSRLPEVGDFRGSS